jgi:hypothetical protein
VGNGNNNDSSDNSGDLKDVNDKDVKNKKEKRIGAEDGFQKLGNGNTEEIKVVMEDGGLIVDLKEINSQSVNKLIMDTNAINEKEEEEGHGDGKEGRGNDGSKLNGDGVVKDMCDDISSLKLLRESKVKRKISTDLTLLNLRFANRASKNDAIVLRYLFGDDLFQCAFDY